MESILLRHTVRLIVVVISFMLYSPAVHGQFDIGQGVSGNGSTQSTANGGDGTGSGLDASDAFSDLQRGDDVGSTEKTGRGFSGSSVSAPGSGTGGVNPGGIGGGIGGVGGFGRLFDGAGGASAESTPPILRTRLRSAIQIQPREPDYVQQVATNRFRSLPSRPLLQGVNVTMQGRTAVLQGQVRDESDRRMSQLLMRLEPGISRVENRLTVSP